MSRTINGKKNKNLTELVFLLDRSGSMAGLEEDTIGGFNSVLDKQRKEEGEALITTILFDNHYEVLHDRRNIKEVESITERDYFVRGSTALLDAVGKAVQKTVHGQKHASEDMRADKVMFVIITDGLENASREYDVEKVKKMISYEKEIYGWEFLYLGANIDAVAAAEEIGISKDRAANYKADKKGTRLNYHAINQVVCELRTGGHVEESWKSGIEEDFKVRGKGKKS